MTTDDRNIYVQRVFAREIADECVGSYCIQRRNTKYPVWVVFPSLKVQFVYPSTLFLAFYMHVYVSNIHTLVTT